MRRLDNAKTYNCPLRFTITDCESGWTDLSCDFYGTIIDIYISYIGYQPSALIEAVRIFHSHEISYRDDYCYSHIDIAKAEDIDTLDYWDMVPMVVEFAWEEEPRRSTWTISRDEKDFGKDDFPVKIKIVRKDDEEISHEFTVRYRDLCYAVAKCYTDMLKRYGFSGYYHGSYGDDINLRQLLEIKGYALGLTSNMYAENGMDNYRLTLTPDEELELLMMDM